MGEHRIHPTAVIHPQAELGNDVEIGPYTVIEEGVELGDGCRVGPFSRLTGLTQIGPKNVFESHCSVGAPPQDLKYGGEPTRLIIGSNNVFREFVTLHRGTPGGGAVTRIGDDGLYMAYVHIAHDCQIGRSTIFANGATLAGHVEVGDRATIGAFSAVHQFCRVGDYAFLGGFTVATKDCLPFMKTVGSRPARCFGPNTIGLERLGFAPDQRLALKAAWRLLHNPKLPTGEALAQVEDQLGEQREIKVLLEFIHSSHRGVILSRG
ncbi:MAG: acyl-ACP--UDP-N-acetylglucosamine O-acyltransferase [Acidobacteria bacterium]|jgi:UDP-N-acetylglucosamine acyltransferase|nr:acyl-ACP--UDP-N-acetylglucosamine O-acyltransferase [Acidobacteriota bacterium]